MPPTKARRVSLAVAPLGSALPITRLTQFPGAAASACRLGEAVGGGDQGAVRSPQRDDVSGDRRCPLVEPPRRGFVRVPEDHLADLAARSPPLAARDAVFAALIQINLGSLMFTLSSCWAGHGTGSYPIGRASERADLSGRCSMASAVGETCWTWRARSGGLAGLIRPLPWPRGQAKPRTG